MFIELHIIQSFPPTNLNRDDMNQPKDTDFGGVRRARVSSQCLKRAIRKAPVFAATTQVPLSARSRFISRALIEGFGQGKPQAEAQLVADLFAEAYSLNKMEGKAGQEKHTAIALYLSPAEIQWAVTELTKQWDVILATHAASEEEKKKKKDEGAEDKKAKKGKKEKPPETPWLNIANELAKQTKGRTTSAPDIALFGRMLADRPDTNVDAACQVVHAISTHIVKMDADFFTAVDELLRPDETGAAMMDIAGFNSACFYRYARLDLDQLVKNLKGDADLARRTVEAFMRASEAATPTGKKNSHDNFCRPAFMFAVARKTDSGGWSLANAFEKPVQVWGGSGLIEPSVRALDQYWNDLCQFYGEQTVIDKAVALQPALIKPDELSGSLRSAFKTSLDAWVQTMLDAIKE
jgi:CRISPR system Cascade subunit CasC